MNSAGKILVVDDEVAVRSFLEKLLIFEGYHPVVAINGEEALTRIAQESFDLALIDLKMPGIDGMEVLAYLRRTMPDTMIIVLTAHGSLETAVEALRQGAHDYLFKPCKSAEIRTSVRMALDKRERELRQRQVLDQFHNLVRDLAEIYPASPTDPQPVPDTCLQRGPLVIDLVQHTARFAGQQLELTPTEFDLLSYIIGEAPRVVSPQELIQKVQGYAADHPEAGEITRTYIYQIRKKIAALGGDKNIIRTVRGIGYSA